MKLLALLGLLFVSPLAFASDDEEITCDPEVEECEEEEGAESSIRPYVLTVEGEDAEEGEGDVCEDDPNTAEDECAADEEASS